LSPLSVSRASRICSTTIRPSQPNCREHRGSARRLSVPHSRTVASIADLLDDYPSLTAELSRASRICSTTIRPSQPNCREHRGSARRLSVPHSRTVASIADLLDDYPSPTAELHPLLYAPGASVSAIFIAFLGDLTDISTTGVDGPDLHNTRSGKLVLQPTAEYIAQLNGSQALDCVRKMLKKVRAAGAPACPTTPLTGAPACPTTNPTGTPTCPPPAQPARLCAPQPPPPPPGPLQVIQIEATFQMPRTPSRLEDTVVAVQVDICC